MTRNILVGAIEAGGTKFICAVGAGPDDRVLARESFPTGDDPVRLLASVCGWLRQQERRHGTLQAIGVACFGPVDLRVGSSTFGCITSTPKPGWKDANVVGQIRGEFGDIPVGFDTDVNGAALGEYHWGHAVGLSDFVYITIGTGIGAGGMSGGQLMHGLVHPEMGHIMIPRAPGDSFKGVCPFHGGCWEGLCSGPAMQGRAGMPAEDIPETDAAWDMETGYIAYAISNIVCVLSPQRVILGGSLRKAGKFGQDRFFKAVQERVRRTLNGYIASPLLQEDIGSYIVPPLLGDDAGICGAIALGQRAVAGSR